MICHKSNLTTKIDMVKLENGERIEDLQFEGLKIIQNKDLYSFTSDSVILANFLKVKSKEIAVEIGAGSGVISILATKKTRGKKFYAVELQEKMFDLLEKNIKLNGLEEKIEAINDNIKNHKKYFESGSVDVVFSNPPYKREGSCELNENESKKIARHEKFLPLATLCDCACHMLKFGGRFYVVYDADRSCELISELMKNKLEPKRMFFTENGKGKTILVVIEAVKGGKHGVLVYPNLVTNDKSGEYLQKVKDGVW